MIADNVPTVAKKPWKVAVEDTMITIAFTGISGLITAGVTDVPAIDIVYGVGLTAALAGILSWAKARNISVGGQN